MFSILMYKNAQQLNRVVGFKNNYLATFFFCVVSFFQAQEVMSDFSFPVEKINLEKKDESRYHIYYQVSFAIDSTNVSRKREDVLVLQVGEKYSKFSSYNKLKKDSLVYGFSKTKTTLGAKELGLIFQYKSLWNNTLLKNQKEKIIIVQDIAKNEYQYEEKQPVFTWNLSNEMKNVFGYQCRKATTHYRGRTYIAWYTTEIPIHNGPYVFEGLPGLILEIYDDKNHYHFKAIALEEKIEDIYLKKFKNILSLTRGEFRKIQKTYHENPGFFHGKAYNSDGSVMRMKSKPLPYNPIELE